MTLGHNLDQPSVYFKPIAQAISNIPAIIKYIQFMIRLQKKAPGLY